MKKIIASFKNSVLSGSSSLSRGFTLVELLIVVTLIGILAVAVLSALNPIEQVNKSRDAGRRADSAQLLQALERYYVNNARFPWNAYPAVPNPLVNAFGARGGFNGVGVCNTGAGSEATDGSAAGGCSTVGVGSLVAADELKTQFTKRRYFDTGYNTTGSDVLYVVKQANSTAVSVCFIPASKTTRQLWNAPGNPLKFVPQTGTGVPTGAAPINCSAQFATGPTWATDATSCHVCVPETNQ